MKPSYMRGIGASVVTNWDPSVAGCVAAISAFILAYPNHFDKWPIVIDAAKFFGISGVAMLGATAKSARRGSNAPSAEADHVVANAVLRGGPPPPRDLESGEAVQSR